MKSPVAGIVLRKNVSEGVADQYLPSKAADGGLRGPELSCKGGSRNMTFRTSGLASPSLTSSFFRKVRFDCGER